LRHVGVLQQEVAIRRRDVRQRESAIAQVPCGGAKMGHDAWLSR
jgi:hypothetical protein